jgi:peptide deformylase
MILPIVKYGTPILRAKSAPVTKDHPNLEALIANMWDTLENANGCGLAAPQIGEALRIFIVDSKTTYEHMSVEEKIENYSTDSGIRDVFINAKITEYSRELCSDTEGCLSIPGMSEVISRPSVITIEYEDLNFQKHVREFSSLTARMIQHEYDHIEGKLYLDYLPPLKRSLLSNKLSRLKKGRFTSKYPMI